MSAPLQQQETACQNNKNEDGIRLALSLNHDELTVSPFGYGFGSYAYYSNSLFFSRFCRTSLIVQGFYPTCILPPD